MGDVVLVNGVPWPTMKVKPRVYRFRVLAAGISRSWRFALRTGDPFYVVGTDGGMTPNVQAVSSWRHGAAERYEVLIDFRHHRPGTKIEMNNLSNKNNVDFPNTGRVMRFEVVADAGPRDTGAPCERLRRTVGTHGTPRVPGPDPDLQRAASACHARRIRPALQRAQTPSRPRATPTSPGRVPNPGNGSGHRAATPYTRAQRPDQRVLPGCVAETGFSNGTGSGRRRLPPVQAGAGRRRQAAPRGALRHRHDQSGFGREGRHVGVRGGRCPGGGSRAAGPLTLRRHVRRRGLGHGP